MENKEFDTNKIELPMKVNNLDENIMEEQAKLEKKLEKSEETNRKYRIIILILILLLLISIAGNIYQYRKSVEECISSEKMNNENQSEEKKPTCSCNCLKDNLTEETPEEDGPEDDTPSNENPKEDIPEDDTPSNEDPKEDIPEDIKPIPDPNPEPEPDIDPQPDTPTPPVSKGLNVEFGKYSIVNGSVKGEVTISEDKLTLYHNETLRIPGEYFEFLIEVRNTGNIDAKLDEFILSEFDSLQKKYLNYTVKYSNGNELKRGDILLSGDVQTLRIRIDIEKDNISKEDLPKENQSIDSSLTLNYIEK